MAEFKNEALGARFTVPDVITVRRQLQYRDRVALATKDSFTERYFEGALVLIDEWECDALPDPHALDMEEATDPHIADVVQWVTNQIAFHVAALREETKNG